MNERFNYRFELRRPMALIPSRFYQINPVLTDKLSTISAKEFKFSAMLTNYPWNYMIEENGTVLGSQIGIYIMWLKERGGWMSPVYIGKAVDNSFRNEAFKEHKQTIYNRSWQRYGKQSISKGGSYYMSFLYADNLRTDEKQKPLPTLKQRKEIATCEDTLIIMAALRSEKLMNSKSTNLNFSILGSPAMGWDVKDEKYSKHKTHIRNAKALLDGIGAEVYRNKNGRRILDPNDWNFTGFYTPNDTMREKMREAIFVDDSGDLCD
jgi:hypothetical protein